VGRSLFATEDFSERPAYLRLAKVEISVVRIGAIVHCVAAFEDSSRWYASTEESLEVRLCGDKVVLVGDVDPTLNRAPYSVGFCGVAVGLSQHIPAIWN
jgi:hypothetical protein